MIPNHVTAEMRKLAMLRYPCEAVFAYWADGTWRELVNTGEAPRDMFALSPSDNRLLEQSPPLVLVHSHCKGPDSARPSDEDTLSQFDAGYTWGIICVSGWTDNLGKHHFNSCTGPEYFGAHRPHEPLLGRSYLWGVRDCYTLVQGYYAQQGIVIPSVPKVFAPLREAPSHKFAHKPFDYWIEELGLWDEIKPWNAEPGDAVTYRLTHHFRDHCAVFLGESKYLEQRGTSLSCIKHHNEAYLEKKGARYYRLKGYNAQDRALWQIKE